MAKDRTIWACDACGEEQTAWAGRCTVCGAWNSLKQVRLGKAQRSGAAAGVPFTPVRLADQPDTLELPRLKSGLGEADRVLGGGFFPGSVVLLAGEPGVGKSTLLLEILKGLSQAHTALYVSGEESVEQVANRARRLKLAGERIELVSSTDLPGLLEYLDRARPTFVIIDSIQTLADPALPSVAGSMIQVRQAAFQLTQWAKATNTTLLIVGHVTKEGVAAGPRILEHIVDVVLYLEGERTSDLRLLRAHKNRFGPTDEVGIFEMITGGLAEVSNPSERFITTTGQRASGTIATVLMEGRRPIIVEIQALVRKTANPYPRRTALGLDGARLEILLAVLESRVGLRMGSYDCFLSVGGGFRIREPAADLAVALALASAVMNRPLPQRMVAFGEIGLSGEIRPVVAGERRFDEAKRLGFEPLVAPIRLAEVLTTLNLRTTRSREDHA